jgi:hypothetical protein
VGDHRTVVAAGTENRSAAAMANARADERDLLRAALALPLANGTSQLPATATVLSAQGRNAYPTVPPHTSS